MAHRLYAINMQLPSFEGIFSALPRRLIEQLPADEAFRAATLVTRPISWRASAPTDARYLQQSTELTTCTQLSICFQITERIQT